MKRIIAGSLALTLALTLALALSLALASPAAAQDSTAAATRQNVTLTGVLVDSSGTGLGGRTVFYVWRDKTGKMLLIYGMTKRGLGLAPSADTDDDGRFSLELFPLDAGASVELGLSDPRGRRGNERSIGEFTIPEITTTGGVRTANLGRVVVR